MTDHIHEQYDRSAKDNLWFCRCGHEWDGKVWREPLTWHGRLRAAGRGLRMDIEKVRE